MSVAAIPRETKGYLGHLTPAEEETLNSVRGRLPEDTTLWGQNLNSSKGGDIIMLKFLRANDFDLEKSYTMLTDSLKWRKENDVDNADALEWPCNGAQSLEARGPCDSEGRPVIYSMIGRSGDKANHAFQDKEVFLKVAIKRNELMLKELSFEEGKAESWITVQDFHGMSIMNQPPNLQAVLKYVGQTTGANYPETRGGTVMLNFPGALQVVFKAVSMFIPAKTLSKFRILGSSDLPSLYDLIPGERVPDCCWGFWNAESPCETPVQLKTIGAGKIEELKIEPYAGKQYVEVRALHYDTNVKMLSEDGEVLFEGEAPLDPNASAILRIDVPENTPVTITLDNYGAWVYSKVMAWRCVQVRAGRACE